MESVRAETLRRDLAHAVRTGPFSAVLHLAIEASGLRLEEIQERLNAQGISVSLTTLSYWRRGRSRPERPDSLRAVRLMEDILSLPADALTSQLGPRRPRGRWLSHPPGFLDIDRLFEDPASASVEKMLGELDNRMNQELTRVSLHDLYVVGANRQEISLTTRQVLRANVDRVSRAVGVFRTDDLSQPQMRINTIRNCRTGRIRADVDSGLLAAELIFDRVLSVGETAVVEYEILTASEQPTDNYYRAFASPVGEFVCQVQFDPTAVPARCYRFEKRSVAAPEQGVREIWIGNTHGAHVVANEVPPGIVGMRWEWQ
ncbi:hypothetical protein [Catelliglobosispora koreensis]|uniref:hypothetical protein n=1 Tax=Catelliglobosispora koreensis TaxID=129052 RepID=UPI000369A85F|nr:hypothetical protein [Catelliglobosispora koreensis]